MSPTIIPVITLHAFLFSTGRKSYPLKTDLTTDEYLDYKREFDYSKKLKTVTNATQSELNGLTNALNLEISEEDSKRAIVVKYYGNYEYTVVNNRDYTYRVVKKKMIKSVYDEKYGSKRTDKNRK